MTFNFVIVSQEVTTGISGLVIISIIFCLLIVIYRRQGRSSVLEATVMNGESREAGKFVGTHDVEEYQPGKKLRLASRSRQSRHWYIYFRWIGGVGKQASFNSVEFDGANASVLLGNIRASEFSEFGAVRMRENAGRSGSVWKLELIRSSGKPLPFATSAFGDRQFRFEQTAPLAKAVAEIMCVPVHVFVDGKVWTPGWPPKN